MNHAGNAPTQPASPHPPPYLEFQACVSGRTALFGRELVVAQSLLRLATIEAALKQVCRGDFGVLGGPGGPGRSLGLGAWGPGGLGPLGSFGGGSGRTRQV